MQIKLLQVGPYITVICLNQTRRTFAPSAAFLCVHENVLQHVATLFVGALVFDALHESVLKRNNHNVD